MPAGVLETKPGGITVGRDGLYVTNNGGSPTDGQVLKIRGLGQLDFLHARENVVLLGPPGPGSHCTSAVTG